MKRRAMGYGYVMLFIFGTLFMVSDHNHFSIGDLIVESLGLHAWSNGFIGFHNTSIYGLVIIVVGWWGTVNYLKQDFSFLKKGMLWIFIIFLFFIAPITVNVIKEAYYHAHHGLGAVEYYPDNSQCNVKAIGDGEYLSIDCELQLVNHADYLQQFQVKWLSDEFIKKKAIEVTTPNKEPYVILAPKKEITLGLQKMIPAQGLTIRQGHIEAPKLLIYNKNQSRRLQGYGF